MTIKLVYKKDLPVFTGDVANEILNFIDLQIVSFLFLNCDKHCKPAQPYSLRVGKSPLLMWNGVEEGWGDMEMCGSSQGSVCLCACVYVRF